MGESGCDGAGCAGRMGEDSTSGLVVPGIQGGGVLGSVSA